MITWSNLWRMLIFQRGTFKPRMLLLAWEAGLGFIMWGAGRYLPAWGLFVGYGICVLAHELFFIAWAERVAKIPPANVYKIEGYVATLERWSGPTA